MSATTLDQLKAYEARLLKALGDPTKAVFYDDFKRENRPVSELQSALATVRAEIARHPDNASAKPRDRFVKVRMRSGY